MARCRHGDRRGVLLTLLQALARDRADEVRNEAIKPNPPTSAGAKRLGERHDRGLPRSRARPGVSRQSTAWRATTIRRTPGRVWRRSCSPASTTSRPVNARPTHAETSVTVMPLWRGRPPAAAVVRAQRSALRRCLVGGCMSGDTQPLGQGFDARRAGSTNTVARRSAAITRSNSAQSGCVPLAAVKTSRNVCGRRSTGHVVRADDSDRAFDITHSQPARKTASRQLIVAYPGPDAARRPSAGGDQPVELGVVEVEPCGRHVGPQVADTGRPG